MSLLSCFRAPVIVPFPTMSPLTLSLSLTHSLCLTTRQRSLWAVRAQCQDLTVVTRVIVVSDRDSAAGNPVI